MGSEACTSVADLGCLSRIPDPNCLHPGYRIRIKEFKYFNPKKNNGFQALENMIRVVHPESRIRMLTFYLSRIPDPGVKKAPDPGYGSATLAYTLGYPCLPSGVHCVMSTLFSLCFSY
jgi:hypothetical protein